jgi:Lrp/AsnC family leucine-responsive transcriptional regulator
MTKVEKAKNTPATRPAPSADADVRARSASDIPHPRRGGALSRLACGAVRFDEPAARNLVAALPGLIRIGALSAPDTETDPEARTDWLGALRDPQIGRALALIHIDPARAKEHGATVAELASRLGYRLRSPDKHGAIITARMGTEAGNGEDRSLDEIDVRILRMLEANGRATYEEIARHVNLSANAVRGRVRSLHRRGVIRGIHADVDWAGGGPTLEALIDIRLRPGADDRAFEEAAIALPGAVLLEHLAGPTHYQLRVAVSTIDTLDGVIRKLKEELQVASTNTKVVTRTLRADRRRLDTEPA